jgi:hypothetical protein
MTEELDMSRYVVYPLDGNPLEPALGTCLNHTDMGSYLVSLVGVGNPCFVFATLPVEVLTADPLAANFNTGLLVSSDYQTNRLAAAAMLESPPEVATTAQDPETTTAVCWPAA